MRRTCILILLMLVCTTAVFAQDVPTFENGYSYLKVTEDRVTLAVCADNIVPGTPVYAVAFRDALTVGDVGRSWGYVIHADETNLMSLTNPSGYHYDHRCVLFDGYPDADGVMMGMEDSGPTYPNFTYYTQATLDPNLSFDTGAYVEDWERGGCVVATEGHGLCDTGVAPDFVRPGYNNQSPNLRRPS